MIASNESEEQCKIRYLKHCIECLKFQNRAYTNAANGDKWFSEQEQIEARRNLSQNNLKIEAYRLLINKLQKKVKENDKES